MKRMPVRQPNRRGYMYLASGLERNWWSKATLPMIQASICATLNRQGASER